MEEYFWSIAIEEGTVQAAIWTLHEGTAKVMEVSNLALWESDEDLLTSADNCLSGCIQNLPENVAEPSKTVFGVPSFWVKDGQIDREYLDKIRLLCNKLSLTPTGFVVMPEAISHFKKAEEKTPLNAVLVGIYTQNIDISVFRLGNLVGSMKVARSVNIIDDVTEGLARFGASEPYPSRFLIYGLKEHELEETKQALIKADWDKANELIKFLHTPQVEIVSDAERMAAVSLAGAAESGNATNVEVANHTKEDVNNVENIEGMVDPASLGFTSSFDLQVNREEKPQNNETYETQNTVHKKKLKFVMPAIPSFRNFKFKFSENTLFILAVVILIGIVAAFVAWWFLPKAQVTILIAPKKIEGRQKITFDPKVTSINFDKKIVPAQTVTTTVTADKTKTVTGTKTIGTPSKGSVTFYNVGGATTIPAGTVLSASSLNFTLDADLQIASASGAASAATATGNVSSAGVGADYNLASGTYFSVGNYSSSLLQAKNDSSFSGGSSQEVTAVSKDDIDSLTNDLVTQLTSNGANNLKTNLEPGTYLIDSSVKATTTNKNADHDVGEQATTVKLSLTMKVEGLSVTGDNMNTLAEKLYGDQVPAGFSLEESQIDYQFGSSDTNFLINLLPTIDTTKVANDIAGKSLSAAKSILSSLPGFTDLEVQMKPSIPFLSILPHVAKNITITLSAR